LIFILGQICDLAEKLESWDHNTLRGSYGGLGHESSGGSGLSAVDKKTEDKLSKATKDSCKITTEVLHGIMTQVKIRMFLNLVTA
jgi:COP9 signalosome complex subunit 5